jgi:hypothetical protein
MRLDRDSALALEIHRVENLRFHFPRLQRAGHLEEAVGQRRLAVVDVRDDGEVADERAGSMQNGARCRRQKAARDLALERRA